jgi:hypothetical protein
MLVSPLPLHVHKSVKRKKNSCFCGIYILVEIDKQYTMKVIDKQIS